MKTLRHAMIILIIMPLLALISCQDKAARMGRGFRLPEGHADQGQTAFIELKCNQCHTVVGAKLPKPEAPSPVEYQLGGEVRKVKSYGELVTAIIQPQHVVSQEYLDKLDGGQRKGAVSPMPNYNDKMTVTQLTNIVTFLHAHYQEAPPPGVKYPVYAP